MSIVYTADVFCDGDECSQWAHGITGAKPPEKWRARERARHDGFVRIGTKDYCPACAKKKRLQASLSTFAGGPDL